MQLNLYPVSLSNVILHILNTLFRVITASTEFHNKIVIPEHLHIFRIRRKAYVQKFTSLFKVQNLSMFLIQACLLDYKQKFIEKLGCI